MTDIKEYIRYKALDIKYGTRSGGALLLDHYLEGVLEAHGTVEGHEDSVFKLQNVCAKLSQGLVERMENTAQALNMSKREFIELAVIQALTEIDAVFEELNLFDDEPEEELKP